MYAENGFDDILYGYPLSEHHMDRNFQLTEKLHQYHVFINSFKSLDILLSHEPPKNKKWSIFLKIDVGYHRAGIPHDETDTILKLAHIIDNNEKLK